MRTGLRDTELLIEERKRSSIALFVIGCSTGGPTALHQIIPELPARFPVPVVVVQHMPPGFVQSLARELNVLSSVKVAVAGHETAIGAGEVWFAPAGSHVAVRQRPDQGLETTLSVGQPVHGCMPAVDPLARSAADVLGDRAALIVLTGMGRDGQKGAGHVRRSGGLVIAQDQSSSRVYGMPRAVVDDELAHAILPPDSIAKFMYDVACRRSCA